MKLDYTALTRTISKQELAAFRSRQKTSGFDNVYLYSIAGLLGIAMLPFVLLWAGVIEHPIWPLTYFAFLFVIILVLARYFSRVTAEKHMRLAEFCATNGFTYIPFTQNPAPLPGVIFNEGHSRQVADVIVSVDTDPSFEIGNYRYTTGSGKNSRDHHWSYVRVGLDRHVPNMVLDSKQNNTHLFGLSMSNLPMTLKKDQVLSLEGDFNNYFTLYAPKDYEQDALYIFTPDFMALLVDETAKYDVEVVDDQLFVYYADHFDLMDQKLVERLFSIINAVGKKATTRTVRYRDERVGDRSKDEVYESGRRLKRGFPCFIIIVAVVIIGINIVPHIIDMIMQVLF